jgi:hypothetical protein
MNDFQNLATQALALANAIKEVNDERLDYSRVRACNIAKDILEMIVDEINRPATSSLVYEAAINDLNAYGPSYYSLDREEREMILGNLYVSAVKTLKDRLGLDLRTAKQTCDEFRDKYMDRAPGGFGYVVKTTLS